MNSGTSVEMDRRSLLKTAAVAALASLPASAAAGPADRRSYPYLGRTEDYPEFRIIDPGLVINAIETWTHGSFGIVRVTTDDGK